jgi:LAGLIDADG endonuclease
MKFVVTDISDIISKIIPHFESYNLKTSKYLNYVDFKRGALIMSEKQHFTLEGISKLKDIKSDMNRARSFEDKFNFC